MKQADVALLLFLGIAVWTAGTVSCGYRGAAAHYRIAFAVAPMISSLLCIAILHWRIFAPARWAAATLLPAIPEMVSEAVVLSRLGTFMPRIHEASGGLYGAFLFATYAIVLAIAAAVTLRAPS